MLPDRNAYFLFNMPETPSWCCIQTPAGALFQCPERFVNHIKFFLIE